MKKLALLPLVVIALSSTNATAGNKAPGSGPNPYSDCGIGAALFKETKWAAVTSNITWDVGTTAITSATASPETCSGKTVQAATFIQQSYDQLVEETAKGEGEYLQTMLNIFECDAGDRPQVLQDVRSQTGQAVSDKNYDSQSRLEKVTKYYQIVDSAVAKSCNVA